MLAATHSNVYTFGFVVLGRVIVLLSGSGTVAVEEDGKVVEVVNDSAKLELVVAAVVAAGTVVAVLVLTGKEPVAGGVVPMG